MEKNIDKILEKTISDIEKIYQESKKHFLSEDDFKCTLFSLFEKNIESMNLSDGLSIHTEVSFYGGNNHLKYRPDLSIFKNEYLNIDDSTFNWSFSEEGVALIIEIKFIKKNSKKIYLEIEDDLKKLSELSKNNRDAKNILFCFDFTSSQYEKIDLSFKDANVMFKYIPRKK